MAGLSHLRYLIGRTFFSMLDFGLSHRLIPFSSRFPVGIRFHHDLNRFLGREPVVVIDAGANIGQTALAYARHWPRAGILSFEPVRSSFAELERNCAGTGIRCVNCALGREDGRVRMRLHDNSELNSFVDAADSAAGGSSGSEEVSVRRLDSVMREFGIDAIDLLKIDTEGTERQVLEGADGLLREHRINAVYAECRFLRNDTPQILFEELDRDLTGRGFYFSGFYEIYRWGASRRNAGFANGLWIRRDLP